MAGLDSGKSAVEDDNDSEHTNSNPFFGQITKIAQNQNKMQ